MRFLDNNQVEVGAVPVDTTGAAVTGDYVSLAGYERLVIIIQQGAWAGGTPAVTLLQATDVSAGNAKALAFTERFTKVGLTGTTFTKTAVTANTFDLPAVANTINVIEVPADSLDVSNDFDCVRVNIATPGANADLIAVTYLLVGARYSQATMQDAKVD
jgi:hypothetical protein